MSVIMTNPGDLSAISREIYEENYLSNIFDNFLSNLAATFEI